MNELNQFYEDTKAENFFKENESEYLSMVKYLQQSIDSTPIENLLSLMEDYVYNKNLYFANQNVHYTSIITLYRPFLASFYTIQMGNEVYLVAQQSLVGIDKNVSNFDLTQAVESAIHEFLHMYINSPVKNHMDLIEELSKDKQKSEYVGTMYQNMDWNRVVDENIVRAVEARIYAKKYGDDVAFKQILEKEITMGGFTKVDKLFESLMIYESNRVEYSNIHTYIPNLLRVIFD